VDRVTPVQPSELAARLTTGAPSFPVPHFGDRLACDEARPPLTDLTAEERAALPALIRTAGKDL
jgi:hypothetical protein